MADRRLKISFGYDGPPAAACDHSFYHVGVMIDGEHWGEDGVSSDWPSDVTEEVKAVVMSRAFVKAAKAAGISPGDTVRVMKSPAIKATPGGGDFRITIPAGRYRVLSTSLDADRPIFSTDQRRKKSSAYLWHLPS